MDFARSTVWIDGEWTDRTITVRIVDDGEGYPPQVIGRIGDPFVRSRRSVQDLAKRPEYEGMGLGLFIAKTLLERTGATVDFRNGRRGGAVVSARWPRSALEAPGYTGA